MQQIPSPAYSLLSLFEHTTLFKIYPCLVPGPQTEPNRAKSNAGNADHFTGGTAARHLLPWMQDDKLAGQNISPGSIS